MLGTGVALKLIVLLMMESSGLLDLFCSCQVEDCLSC